MSISVNWRCPKCGKGFSATALSCDYCGFVRPVKPS